MTKTRLPFTPPGIAGVMAGGIDSALVRKAVNAGAEMLELRIDTFEARSPAAVSGAVKRLRSMEAASKLPLIATVRDVKEGGRFSVDDREKEEILLALLPHVDMIDIELRRFRRFAPLVDRARRLKKAVILSYHDFRGTPPPSRLREIVRRASGPGIIAKVATAVESGDDLRKLAALLLEYDRLVVLGMGDLGRATRVFFPVIGSLITYGSLTEATAPGQMSVREIIREFEFYGFKKKN